MTREAAEEYACCLFEKHIREHCKSRWLFLEYEDRLSEAMIAFGIALQIFSTSNGCFWQNYCIFLEDYMRKQKKEYQRPYGHYSLDSTYSTHKRDGRTVTLHAFIGQRDEAFNPHPALAFWDTLSANQQQILEQKMEGKSVLSISKRMHIPLKTLVNEIERIRTDYLAFYTTFE